MIVIDSKENSKTKLEISKQTVADSIVNIQCNSSKILHPCHPSNVAVQFKANLMIWTAEQTV